jgi:hypothetical protein
MISISGNLLSFSCYGPACDWLSECVLWTSKYDVCSCLLQMTAQIVYVLAEPFVCLFYHFMEKGVLKSLVIAVDLSLFLLVLSIFALSTL